jgi:hypothetical protein
MVKKKTEVTTFYMYWTFTEFLASDKFPLLQKLITHLVSTLFPDNKTPELEDIPVVQILYRFKCILLNM